MQRLMLSILIEKLLINLSIYLDAVDMEIKTFLTHCDTVKKQISIYAKELIDLIKEQEKELKDYVNDMTVQQLE